MILLAFRVEYTTGPNIYSREKSFTLIALPCEKRAIRS
jgi:hypothetical protein